MGSRTEAGIWVGGGPVLVRNNVAIGSRGSGIELQDYAKRGLLRGIVIAHNTVYANGTGGITVPQQGRVQATIVNNAVQARGGGPPIPIGRAGVLSLGNADCTLVPCFVDPEIRDFSPLALRSGVVLGETWMPADDYFGRARGGAPTVGAVDQQAGPVPLGIKAQSP